MPSPRIRRVDTPFEVSVHSAPVTQYYKHCYKNMYAAVYKDGSQALSYSCGSRKMQSLGFSNHVPVSLILRDKMDAGLDRLVERGIISPVKHSKWSAPIVPIVKKNDTLRLCGNYKVTVNLASAAEFLVWRPSYLQTFQGENVSPS